jgi:Transposase DDE domain group 1
MRETRSVFANIRYFRSTSGALAGMGLVITPLNTPRRFKPLAQPMETPQNLGGRELVWRFDGGDITSDGGALLLKRLEQRTGIVRRFAACFTDYRRPGQIEHPLLDLVTQRVFGLALGYEDLNDHDQLRSDPMLAAALGKDDLKGEQRRRKQDRGKALAGKSTLNRLELTAPDYEGCPLRTDSDKPETKKIGVDPESIDTLLVDLFLEAYAQVPDRIILDLDATDDTLYGNQEGRFYHGYYHDYCYLPLYVFCGEHLLCSRLRMSNIDASADSVEELEPMVARIRQRWPSVKIWLRGDGGFCREKLMAWCQSEGIDYIFGLAQNARLKKLIEAQMAEAEKQHAETKAPARVFSEFFYSTKDTWSRERRVIAKAEHLDQGGNPRFIVTSLSPEEMAAQELYEKVYCARGECAENRIKEQQLDLFADRTSTGKMWSNQLRLYFSSITYVLMQTLRRTALAGTELEKAQCGTIRLKLFKIGAQVRVTVRKVWISLSGNYPYAALFTTVLTHLETGRVPS